VLDVLFCGLKASPVAWTSGILYRDLGKKNRVKKISNFFGSAANFVQFLAIKPWIRIGNQPKMLDPDSMNPDPKH
jgi:hypothetical protein